MRTLAGSIVLFAILASAASAAEFHKWRDENGVWHYSETPPEDRASTPVAVDTYQPALPPPVTPLATASSAAAPAATTSATDAAASQPGPAPATAAQPAAPVDPATVPRLGLKDRKANCDRTRLNVATLENYAKVTLDRNNDGEPETLTDAEHLAELEKARAQVKVFCSPG